MHQAKTDFNPRSPCGERPLCADGSPLACRYFNPRSPCGERQFMGHFHSLNPPISIHALLAESDSMRPVRLSDRTDFNPRSPCGERPWASSRHSKHSWNFNPRSPCGERPVINFFQQLPGNFNPRSPCGERRRKYIGVVLGEEISIHALLAESDKIQVDITVQLIQFQSTLSLRRATGFAQPSNPINHEFQSTLSLRRATLLTAEHGVILDISIHALLAESDPS